MSKHRKPNGIKWPSARKPHNHGSAGKLPENIRSLLDHNRLDEAEQRLNKALAQKPNDAQLLNQQARLKRKQGDNAAAETLLNRVIELAPGLAEAHFQLAELLHAKGSVQVALKSINRALELNPGNLNMLERKALILSSSGDYDAALKIYDELIKRYPDDFSLWNNKANTQRDLGMLDDAVASYDKAMLLTTNDLPYSNKLTTLHYHPEKTREQIFSLLRQWQHLYGPENRPARPEPTDKSPDKVLRIGLFSDGFRTHPVGQMITSALEQLPHHQLELFCYSTNPAEDHITRRFKAISRQWMIIQHLNDEQFTEQVRRDHIDILVDLSGHNAGTKMRTMAMQPAPLLVKWVGGLINSTGLETIDYLITDNIESPAGEDAFYTEKLIRLPDDYICYTPPNYMPEVKAAPVHSNGYITLGCFNNPTKINNTLLEQWAKIMHQIPGCKLFLKGSQFASEALKNRVIDVMDQNGIGADRLIIEGKSPHRELLESYNRVDIALDPWPYSGGLTTCEAMMMGVPVVSLPGPTFAGRHSATHLTNAGMANLVAENWQQYQEKVLTLATDITILDTLRTHLRPVLLASPVCDAKRFASHLSTAMRAIWQRYIQQQPPAALSINQQGEAQFEGDDAAIELSYPAKRQKNETFSFNFEGNIVILDSGANWVNSSKFSTLHQTGAITTLCFDPAGRIKNPEYLPNDESFYYIPFKAIGNGEPNTLYITSSSDTSGTIEPFPPEQQPKGYYEKGSIISKIPIATIKAKDIRGLSHIDWLVLDNTQSTSEIINSAGEFLDKALLVQARVNFTKTHKNQVGFAELENLLNPIGLNFHCFMKVESFSHLSEWDGLTKIPSSHLLSADAIFVRNYKEIDRNQKIKLSFLLSNALEIKDLSAEIIGSISKNDARKYLIHEGFLKKIDLPLAPFMTPNEQKLFKRHLVKAKHYFEFGSGGSTIWAVEQGLIVKGVESDSQWVLTLKDKLGEACQVKAVDIGPTKEWGFPVSIENSDCFYKYSTEILNHSEAFDLILVDGRFRVASILNSVKHILEKDSNSKIFIHDFWNRPQYHIVLKFLDCLEKEESAGVFKIKDNIDQEVLSRMINDFLKNPM